MDVSVIQTLVGSLGFPIVACGGMAWFCATVLRDVQKTVENNTLVITKIVAKLGGIDIE